MLGKESLKRDASLIESKIQIAHRKEQTKGEGRAGVDSMLPRYSPTHQLLIRVSFSKEDKMASIATWKVILLNNQKLSMHDQLINKDLIVKAFKELWDSKPTESELSTYMSGIVPWSEIRYYMEANPQQRSSYDKE